MEFKNITKEQIAALVESKTNNKVVRVVRLKATKQFRVTITNQFVDRATVYLTVYEDGIAYGATANTVNVMWEFSELPKVVPFWNLGFHPEDLKEAKRLAKSWYDYRDFADFLKFSHCEEIQVYKRNHETQKWDKW